MNKNPLITVITVVYNAVSTIEETILSVVNQTYNNVEYLVIDGGSTDGTLDIIKKYENRISKWISEPDNGIYDAMNKGIDLATGEWINFMNAGDGFCKNTVIETFVNLYDHESEVVYGDSQRVFSVGTYTDKGQLSTLKYMPNCHQAFFIKTHLLKKRNFDINYSICADADFFYNIYQTGCKYQHIPVTVCRYDCIDGLSSKSSPRFYMQEIATIEGVNKTIKWKIKYFILLLKLQTEKVVPSGIREKRLKRQLDKIFLN